MENNHQELEQLMMFDPQDVFKASWKENNYKHMRLVIDRIPVPKQGDRSKIQPLHKGVNKNINGENYFRLKDLFVRHYQNDDLVKEIEAVKWLLKSQSVGHKPFEEEIIISKLDFIFPPLESMSKKQTDAIKEGAVIPKTTRGDIDNHMKMIFDCCNDIIWKDDARIWWIGNIRKIFGPKGQIIIEVYGR